MRDFKLKETLLNHIAQVDNIISEEQKSKLKDEIEQFLQDFFK